MGLFLQIVCPYNSGFESLMGIQRSPKDQGRMIQMFWPLFFSGKEIALEKLSIFSKIPQKLTVFQDVHDCHLILGEKQRLKQVEKCSLVP